MTDENSQLHIEWKVKQEPPSKVDIIEWENLVSNSSNVTSTNSIKFNINGLKLSNNLKPIYVFGYINEAENKQLKIVLILIQKTKKLAGVKFSLLQPISHDHVDMMSIIGGEYLNNINCISSLKQSLNENLNNWSMLSARRVRYMETINPHLISPSYTRESAYFHLSSDESDKLELKNIIPKKLYKNIARFERKIENEQQTVLQLISNTSKDDVNTALSDFFTLEASGWKGKAGSAIQCNSQLETFYRKSWESFASDSFAKIFVLKSGDNVIASGIAFQTKDELILHKIAFDESLSQYGPGSILVKRIMQNAIDEGLVKSICFSTNPAWLIRWHPQRYNLVAIQIFNTNLKGRIIKFLFGTVDKLRIIKRQIKKMDQQRKNK